MGILTRILKFFAYSNLYLAIGCTALTASTLILEGYPIKLDLLFIPFSGALFIYSFNRYTDLHEDSINVPERVNFFRRHGKLIIFCSIVLYIIAIFLAFRQNVYTLIVTVSPVIIGFLYSHFRVKRLFFIKNLVVVFGLSCSILLVFTYFNHLDLFGILFWLFFIAISLINVIIFDVKDIEGDRLHGIRTIPDEFGVHKTKMICWALFIISIVIFSQLIQLDLRGISLIPFLIYIAYYIHLIPESKEAHWWYYGLFVDGEFLVLLFSNILVSTII